MEGDWTDHQTVTFKADQSDYLLPVEPGSNRNFNVKIPSSSAKTVATAASTLMLLAASQVAVSVFLVFFRGFKEQPAAVASCLFSQLKI